MKEINTSVKQYPTFQMRVEIQYKIEKILACSRIINRIGTIVRGNIIHVFFNIKENLS